MIHQPRISWDTTVKHYIRFGLYNNLPFELQSKISKSNKHRWSKESDDKYKGCEIAKFIKDEIELVKQIGKSRNAKKMIKVYLRISKIYHSAICNLKGIKAQINLKKDSIVNTIEKYKSIISIKTALKIVNISRATYQNYKTLVLNKCDSSYFLWCVKKYPQQLLRKDIMMIKNYMLENQYQYWSKSSVFF